jgi:hypothetical protein
MDTRHLAVAVARFALFFMLAVLALGLVMLLGYRGPWYLAWISGIAMTVLVTGMSAIYLEQQEKSEKQLEEGERSPPL